MAAAGSLSNPLPLRSTKISFRESFQDNLLPFGGNFGRMRIGSVLKLRSFAGFRLNAVGGNGIEEEMDDEGITDEALRATIRKSKKVLAIQKDLLNQITERRKLISSLKDSVANPEQNADMSYDASLSSMSGNIEREYGSTIASESNELDVSGSLNEVRGASNVGQIDAAHSSKGYVADVLGLQRETDSGQASPSIAAPLISESLKSVGYKDAQSGNSGNLGVQNEFTEISVAHYEVKRDHPLAGDNVMNIILVSAECAPWSKTGGLGDVAGALPKALAKRGHRVMVASPRYADYSEAQELGERRRYYVNGQDMEVAYFHAFIDGVDFVFIDNPIFHHLGDSIYGGDRLEILTRMVLFCKAAVEAPWHIPCGGVCYGDGNLVFIANDWHTALLAVYLKAYYRDNGFMTYARCVLVIHNIAHQGRGPLDDFSRVDLQGQYRDLFRLYDPFGGEHFNIFAAGLRTADRVVTVSHGYAWELKTSEGGWGLHEIINECDWKFSGIVNGVDTKDWNPRYDVYLQSDGYTNYSLETLRTGKPQCKAALQRELGLPVRNDVPVLGFIGRLDHQKGVDLIAEAMPWIAGQDVQVIMLGSGRQDLEDTLRRLESQHYDRVRGWVGFSVKLAHRITAGADVLLMPSRFEPCGLNQLYAMMYGTIPVVHAVGGLRDTVPQYNPYGETGLGWTFEKAEANRLIDALGHCLNTYRHYKQSWEGLQRRGMMQDLSWENAAKQYEEVVVAAKYQW